MDLTVTELSTFRHVPLNKTKYVNEFRTYLHENLNICFRLRFCTCFQIRFWIEFRSHSWVWIIFLVAYFSRHQLKFLAQIILLLLSSSHSASVQSALRQQERRIEASIMQLRKIVWIRQENGSQCKSYDFPPKGGL